MLGPEKGDSVRVSLDMLLEFRESAFLKRLGYREPRVSQVVQHSQPKNALSSGSSLVVQTPSPSSPRHSPPRRPRAPGTGLHRVLAMSVGP